MSNFDGPPYTKKKKSFARKTQKPIDPAFQLPKPDMDFVLFLRLMKSEDNIAIIKREVRRVKGGNSTRETRGNSDSLQGALEIAYSHDTTKCRSETICLLHVLEEKITRNNIFEILEEINELIDALFPIAKSISLLYY